MNILKFELKKYLPSSLIWAFSLTFFGFICIQLFVSFSADMTFFENMLNAYSPEMLKAFGAELSTVKSLTGFYGFCFMYVMVVAAFQAMYMGMHVVGKELTAKTADFLYTKPVSRHSILFQKLCSAIICIVLTNLIYGVGTYISAFMTNVDFNRTLLITINVSMLLTQILFLSVGFLLACFMKKIKSPLTLTAGIVCSFFLLQMIVNLEPEGILSYFSFLNYLSADSIIRLNGFDVPYLCLLIGLCIASLASAFACFYRRDIQAL